MIGSIRGKIILKTEKFLIVETGGVGYKINVSPDTLSKTSSTRSDLVESFFGFTPMCGKTLWIYTDF